MDTKTRGILMTAFEAAMQLGNTRQAVDNNNLKLAESRFNDYLSTLNRMVKDCTDGKRDLNYVVSESPSGWSAEGWLNAMKKDVKTIKGDTEAGAILIATLLDDCGCTCHFEKGA